uniref:Uncharacterized protein n=1 Tax=Gloeothece verrucosa (strain PCC 7822) TaxID=497965 RepID=E0U6Z4_GLOV7|nr:hypothetical protein Cyan7822_4111 [Gloeothece verrucosa PCC 7822]
MGLRNYSSPESKYKEYIMYSQKANFPIVTIKKTYLELNRLLRSFTFPTLLKTHDQNSSSSSRQMLLSFSSLSSRPDIYPVLALIKSNKKAERNFRKTQNYKTYE